MTRYRINETAQQHSIYEVEAASPEAALDVLKASYADEGVMVEEFWGETFREIEEVPA